MKKHLLVAACLGLALIACSTKKYIRGTTDLKVDRTEARVARGSYIVTSVAGCGVCHTGRESGSLLNGESTNLYLAGGSTYVVPAMKASVYFPNITPDVETGIGGWTDDEIIRAIRDGVRKDGRLLFPMMPFGTFQYLSDEDVQSVVAYLRTVPAMKEPHPRTVTSVKGMGGFMLKHGVAHHTPVPHVAEPDKADKLAYGLYVTRMAQCGDCHSSGARGPRKMDDPLYFAGGEKDELAGVGTVYFRNLTPDMETGLGKYTAEQIKQAMRSGTRLDGKKMAPPMSMMITHYATMTDEYLDAIVGYLKSLKPVKNAVPERKLTPEA